jgi:cell division protease FtsH
MTLGGRVAEELVIKDISAGASGDIQAVSKRARLMVTEWGMSERVGPISYGSEKEIFIGRDMASHVTYSEQTAALIDAEIKKIIDEAYANAKALLMANRDKLDFITDFLCKYEIMDDEEFTKAMQDGTTMAELDFMVELKRQKSQDENEAQRRANEEAARREEEERKKRDAEMARMNRPYGDLK